MVPDGWDRDPGAIGPARSPPAGYARLSEPRPGANSVDEPRLTGPVDQFMAERVARARPAGSPRGVRESGERPAYSR